MTTYDHYFLVVHLKGSDQRTPSGWDARKEERRMETKTIEELQRLSDEKLKQLALQRHKGGRRKSTTTALRAQLVLWRRAGKPFQSEAHWVRNHSETGVHF